MTMSALFELFVALLGVASTCYLVYAYCQFIKEEVHHFLHHNPPALGGVFFFGGDFF